MKQPVSHLFRLLLLMLLLPLVPHGAEETETSAPGGVSDLSSFGALPVLHDGRKMPLDTFARIKLLQLSGKTSFQRRPAIEWFARVCFSPEAARQEIIDSVERFQSSPDKPNF